MPHKTLHIYMMMMMIINYEQSSRTNDTSLTLVVMSQLSSSKANTGLLDMLVELT